METEWKQYPVLHLDLNAEKYDSPERLGNILSNQLTQWEALYGKGADENTLSTRFSGIIRRACEQARVAVSWCWWTNTTNPCCKPLATTTCWKNTARP